MGVSLQIFLSLFRVGIPLALRGGHPLKMGERAFGVCWYTRAISPTMVRVCDLSLVDLGGLPLLDNNTMPTDLTTSWVAGGAMLVKESA